MTRRAAKRREEPKLKIFANNVSEMTNEFGKWLIIATIVTFVVSLFLVAALYTPWTGTVGWTLSNWLLKYVGGSVIIILAFVIYLCVSKLISRKVPNLIRQILGTLLLFVLASMLLGIGELTNAGAMAKYHWLAAGRFGAGTADAVYSSIGALGTFLCGAAMLCAAIILYKIPLISKIKLPDLSSRKHADTVEDTKVLQEEPDGLADEDEIPADEEQESEQHEADAPNITDCDGTSGYFKSGQTAEDSVSYRGRKDSSDTGDVADAQIQDPAFNLGDNGSSGVDQGVFPPPADIFGPEESHEGEMDEEKARPLGDKIIKALEQFSIEAALAEILVGPTVIQFRIQLAPGIKVSKVAALANDIALATAVPSLRIEAPIPGKPYVGIEIPNPKRRGIPLRTVIESKAFMESDAALPLPFGLAVNGDSVVVGLEDLPHILIAGTTGSGKSVFINACIVGLCSMRTPEELRMILVDPKRVEMAIYDRLPHLLTPPVTDTKKAVHVLAWAIRQMENRYSIFAKARVRNLEGFNEKALPKDRLPHIVIVVDELADLMMTAPKEVEEYICRLAQMARATGIHLMLATQRPSVNVITGLIKANIPARVAFTLPSNADSRTIIDCAGAEKLLGKGDMLFLSTKYPKPIRIQSPWIDENALAGWLNYLGNLFGEPNFTDIEEQEASTGTDGGTYDDEMLEDAISCVMTTGIASASGLQRRLRVGFSRASRLIDMMEQLGIVGPADGARPREILTDEEGAKELLEQALGGEDD